MRQYHRLGGQADAIVMMAMDFDKNKTSMIAIPRDTITDVAVYSVGGSYAGMRKQQLCLAYAYGDGKESSCENMVASVRRIFYNIPISTYFALDLDGISELNDAVGGVDVISPETIEQFVEGEEYHLVGDEAETFVRRVGAVFMHKHEPGEGYYTGAAGYFGQGYGL